MIHRDGSSVLFTLWAGFGWSLARNLVIIFGPYGGWFHRLGDLGRIGKKGSFRFIDAGTVGARGFAVVLLASSPWAISLILASGGLLAVILGKAPEKGGDSEFSPTRIPRGLFILFVALAGMSTIALPVFD